jgi:hypothetical protein
MPTDPHLTRRGCLGLVAGGGPVGLAGCLGDLAGTADDASTTDEPGTDGTQDRVVRLSPVEDRGEVWHTGLVAIYPTDLTGWLREVATHDRTLRKHVSTAQEMPDPPLQVLGDVRFVGLDDAPFLEDAGEITGHYDLDVEAGPYYEMVLDAEPADPPADAAATPVESLVDQHREVAVAAIEDGEDDTDANRVYTDTDLAEWAREEFIDGYYRYDGNTYRGDEVQRTDAASATTEAWYELSASPSREGDDDTYLLLPDLAETVRTELDAAGVNERTDDLVIEEPPESLVAFADRIAMLVTHLVIFRVRLETV